MKRKSEHKSKKVKNDIFVNFLISLICGLITAIVGALFSFWLTKTFGFSIIGGIYG